MMSRKYITLVLMPMLAVVLAVFQQVRAVNVRYSIEMLQSEVNRQTLEKEVLEGELARLKSPAVLLGRADEMGMCFEVPGAQDSRIAMGGPRTFRTRP